MSKSIHVGTFHTKPVDLTKNRGHEYGAGRPSRPMKDKRHRRKGTRRAQLRDALRGW